MSDYTIIVINREFGCGAREIARNLTSDLGIHFYDKELIDLAAEKAGVNQSIIQRVDESVGGRHIGTLFRDFGYGSTTSFFSDKAIEAQADVIREIAARKKTCVIFGRCADYYLREYSNVVAFFLYAPMSYRIRHISESNGLTYDEAEKLIKRVDRQKHDYYKYITGKNRGDRFDKHMMIDVAKFGVEGSVTMMKDALDYLQKTKS
ncbi:MAG: cytidylate kinase-like family protein [Lachnospiraceae bacterium]|nr:cytidylate kinase-like family protein [Lachnospiraceae bacterium]